MGDNLTEKEMLLKHAADKLAGEKDFLSYWLHLFIRDADLREETVALWLGFESMEQYYLLCLCKFSKPKDFRGYVEYINRVASYVKCNVARLKEAVDYSSNKYF